MNMDKLKSSKFKRMMLDSGIGNRINARDIDILFAGETHSLQYMTFKSFLTSLTKVASIIYPARSRSPVESFHKLLHEHLLPIWDEIMMNPN